jgi:uncharacterized glyoxalase superfamily protein PhnB
MKTNRSMMTSAVIPVLTYPDVVVAAEWLCTAFGFTQRLRIFTHRIQLNAGAGHLVVADGATSGDESSVMIRVADADAHCAIARSAGAHITNEPADYPFGERQYSAVDFAGRRWTFSQTIDDVDPASWGGELVSTE